MEATQSGAELSVAGTPEEVGTCWYRVFIARQRCLRGEISYDEYAREVERLLRAVEKRLKELRWGSVPRELHPAELLAFIPWGIGPGGSREW
jgi:hypothetical protein|nr:MAG: hypothetical protein KatS3mg041_0172 [Bacteroidota bacterium]